MIFQLPPRPTLPGCMKRSMTVITELRKIAMHPLLVRHRYTDDHLKEISKTILLDPKYADSDPILVYEDMTVMSDYELHCLCTEHAVRHTHFEATPTTVIVIVQVLKEYALTLKCIEDSAKFKYLKAKLQELKNQVQC